MKTLISENGGYTLFVEIVEPICDVGKVQLKFTTQWTGSSTPDEFKNKFEAMLTKEEIQRLKDFL